MNTRKRLVVGILLIAVIGFAIWVLSPASSPPSVPSNGYYTGPMRSKSNPNVWINNDGQQVPPPADAFPPPSEPVKPGNKVPKD